VNGGAGACCWANSNLPVLPRSGYEFRYVAAVPSAPACTQPGYFCSGSTAVPCPKGKFCVGGGAPATLCPVGSYSEQLGNAFCWTCDNPTYSTASTGADSWTACIPTCTSSGFYCPASTPLPCPAGYVCPGGAAYFSLCPAGTYSAASAVTCTGCPAGFTTNGPGKTSSAACVACPANSIPVLLPVGSTAQGCAVCAAGTVARPGEIRCSSASNQAVFTPGNLLFFLAGDGTVAGSPTMSSTFINTTDIIARAAANGLMPLQWPTLYDRSSISSVTGKIAEFALSAAGALAATGKSAALPTAPAPWGSNALSTGPVSVLGDLADIGNSNQIAADSFANFTYQPFSAYLSPSTDGTIVSFAGYAMAPGVPVGWSSMQNIYGGGAGVNNNKNWFYQLPTADYRRVIAWFDSSGVVRVVNADLSSPSVCGQLNMNSALYVNNKGPGNSGFYVSCGSNAKGGVFWVSMPYGIGGPAGSITQICAQADTPALNNNWRMYSNLNVFQGWTYVARATAGGCPGCSGLGPGGGGCGCSLRARMTLRTQTPALPHGLTHNSAPPPCPSPGDSHARAVPGDASSCLRRRRPAALRARRL
jgi:hypothetical protein